MRGWVLAAGLLAMAPLDADWIFGERKPVSRHSGSGVFHHLDSSGRSNISVSDSTVAVVWEDNHDEGVPAVYVAMRPRATEGFTAPRRLSGGGAAYEPALATLGDDRFLIAWEQDGAILGRVVGTAGEGPVTELAAGGARQVSVSAGHRPLVAWSARRADGGYVIRVAAVEVAGWDLRPSEAVTVEPRAPRTVQAYPVVIGDETLCVAWEDRRRGASVVYHSRFTDAQGFSAPQPVSEVIEKSATYGKGSGATRVSLAAIPGGAVVAVWLDKRHRRSGYAVYASLSDDGCVSFGANNKVQDEFGDEVPQWNASVASSAMGTIIAGWDDNRDDSRDIWLSRLEDGEWSQDIAAGAAAGEGRQAHLSLALDRDDNLHLVWIDDSGAGEHSSVWYSLGRR